jgi:hypothetical protein
VSLDRSRRRADVIILRRLGMMKIARVVTDSIRMTSTSELRRAAAADVTSSSADRTKDSRGPRRRTNGRTSANPAGGRWVAADVRSTVSRRGSAYRRPSSTSLNRFWRRALRRRHACIRKVHRSGADWGGMQKKGGDCAPARCTELRAKFDDAPSRVESGAKPTNNKDRPNHAGTLRSSCVTHKADESPQSI